ncbi:MAG: hypothetical protein ABI274_07920, partial [Ktedonobacterales bacterium]
MSIAFGWNKRAEQTERRERAEQGERNGLHRLQQFERISDGDHVTLADGSVMMVQRASLVAAKDLLAAQKAAERRVAERQAALRRLEELRANNLE